MECIKRCKSYFAAANGYGGFRSYFGTVFAPQKFKKLFIIKGGPGTGKSTLIKRIAKKAEDAGFYTERIFCSSDPKSLDGIIIENGDRRIGMLDGTAPHMTDPSYPGAIDTIINLGECWDERWLEAKRNEIIELDREKKNAYHTAYNYLSICGECERLIKGDIDFEKIEEFSKKAIKYLAESFKESEIKYSEDRLLSSFGRFGYHSLAEEKAELGEALRPSDDTFISRLIITEIRKKLHLMSVPCIGFPDPLNAELYDSLYIPEAQRIITADGGKLIDLAGDDILSSVELERQKIMRRAYAECTNEAERWFSIASDFHFRLEEIYTQTMDFDKIDAIFNQKCDYIMSLLS